MLTFRTFRNPDPPTLTTLWQSRAGQPGLVQPISPYLLEQFAFAKLYFDPRGLFLAFDDDRPVGFAHAGFGPNQDESWISTETGVICMVLVVPGCDETGVAVGLLEQCETYLRDRGAKVIFGGGLYPRSPFYLGLYGGCELPGVLDSDTVARSAFSARGYQESERTAIFRRELGGFESMVDRQQMQIRRQVLVEVTNDAPTRTWWEASALGEFDLTRFDIVPRTGGPPVATATFRAIECCDTNSACRAAGLMSLEVDPSHQRRGVATFLLGEAFRQFQRFGINCVEAQTRQSNAAAMQLFQKLGFQQAQSGVVWRKGE